MSDPFRGPRPLYATCDAGLEPLLVEELRALGVPQERIHEGHRGVGFIGDRTLCWQVNLWSRVANRVLLPVAEFPATDRDSLYAGVRRVSWVNWFQTRRTIAMDASSHKSQLDHTAFIGQVAKDAVCDAFRDETGERPSVDKTDPDVPINIRIDQDHVIVSIDTSGQRLHKRGYRRETGPAPIKETLAAAMIKWSGWTPDLPLVDPMCGSGTFLIEAALIARNVAPGRLRLKRRGVGFAFQRLRGHDQSVFDKFLVAQRALEDDTVEPQLLGRDLDESALQLARRNAARAAVASFIELEHGPLIEAESTGPTGVVITNPPYGERLGSEEDLRPLYRQIGHVFKHKFPGWTGWLIASYKAPYKAVGFKASTRRDARNGKIQCKVLSYEIYAGRRDG